MKKRMTNKDIEKFRESLDKLVYVPGQLCTLEYETYLIDGYPDMIRKAKYRKILLDIITIVNNNAEPPLEFSIEVDERDNSYQYIYSYRDVSLILKYEPDTEADDEE